MKHFKKLPQLNRVEYISLVDSIVRDYFLYTPSGFDKNSDEKLPVILFLHGNGERGNGKEDLDYVITHGPLYEAWIQKRDLPFLIISPQLPMFGMDNNDYIQKRTRESIPVRLEEGVPPRPEEFGTPEIMAGALVVDTFPTEITLPMGWEQCEADLLNIIEYAIENYNADSNRIYLTGLSYGGFGTWYIASKHPEKFAAICPIVGWGHPDIMEPIAKAQLPVWAFSGGRDFTVETKFFYAGINKLEELGHKNVRYTIHSDMGHDAWRRVYEGEDIYNWFLQFSKKQ
jgi:predicted peptidase